jgi:tRNA uridine 5-carboxymethylaminomethyl modification enzyme
MIDDLVTRPPTEPYRMFTSRAEYRLCLRYDNADQRLTPLGREVGLVDDNRWKRFTDKSTSIERLQGLTDKLPWQGVTLSRWLARPDASEADLRAALNDHQLETGTTNGVFTDDAIRQVFVASRYRGYLDRQTKQIERFAQMEETRIPERLDFANMPELRLEAREKFARHEPRTLGQAARISGINPSDITILWLYTKGRSSRTSSRIDHPSPNG